MNIDRGIGMSRFFRRKKEEKKEEEKKPEEKKPEEKKK